MEESKRKLIQNGLTQIEDTLKEVMLVWSDLEKEMEEREYRKKKGEKKKPDIVK